VWTVRFVLGEVILEQYFLTMPPILPC
jgi:hypothetical protein